MWVHVKRGTRARCAHCTLAVSFGGVEMYIDRERLESGRLAYHCHCGELFTLQDLLRAGAVLVDRVHLERTSYGSTNLVSVKDLLNAS